MDVDETGLARITGGDELAEVRSHLRVGARTEQVEAPLESMLHVLAFVRREFGSMDGYLQSHGGDATLPDRLRAALLD